MKKRVWHRVFLISFLALLIYGSWAWAINRTSGSWVGIKSAIAQGGMSFLVTAFMTIGIEYIHQHLKSCGLQFWFAALSPIILLLIMMIIIHWALGTPHIFMTIMPSAIVGLTYSLIYTFLLGRAKRV